MAENKGFTLKTFGMPWWLAGAILPGICISVYL